MVPVTHEVRCIYITVVLHFEDVSDVNLCLVGAEEKWLAGSNSRPLVCLLKIHNINILKY